MLPSFAGIPSFGARGTRLFGVGTAKHPALCLSRMSVLLPCAQTGEIQIRKSSHLPQDCFSTGREARVFHLKRLSEGSPAEDHIIRPVELGPPDLEVSWLSVITRSGRGYDINFASLGQFGQNSRQPL
jgi:hypothetical protein